MEQKHKLAVPVLLGTLLSILLNKKKDATTISIEIVSGVATAFYLAPYIVEYFNFPETITAFGVGTASSKICLAIYNYFGKQDPIQIILENASVSANPEGLD
jgi:hypothetical protein